MAFKRLKSYGKLVMFSHTLFSLPFGLIAMLWAQGAVPPLRTFLYILGALVGARNGANAFNRIADVRIDAKNARTADRPLQTGKVKLWEAWAITLLCFGLLAFCAYKLNPLCLALLPLAIFIFFFYSYTKRFTWLCHFVLGLACGGAPVGAWIAVTGRLSLDLTSLTPFALGGAVCFWVAGFDILYATQDIEFDRKERLHSVPARFGLRGGLWFARLSHLAAVCALLVAGYLGGTGLWYYVGAVVVAALLCVEHWNVTPGNRKKMSFIAYGMNQVVSVAFFLFALIDFLARKGDSLWSMW